MILKMLYGTGGLLGEHNTEILHNTVLFLIRINCSLWAGDEHYDLSQESKLKPSQISFEHNAKGEHCLVYREDTVTKMNDGGLAHMQKDQKMVWVYPSENVQRCSV